MPPYRLCDWILLLQLATFGESYGMSRIPCFVGGSKYITGNWLSFIAWSHFLFSLFLCFLCAEEMGRLCFLTARQAPTSCYHPSWNDELSGTLNQNKPSLLELIFTGAFYYSNRNMTKTTLIWVFFTFPFLSPNGEIQMQWQELKQPPWTSKSKVHLEDEEESRRSLGPWWSSIR